MHWTSAKKTVHANLDNDAILLLGLGFSGHRQVLMCQSFKVNPWTIKRIAGLRLPSLTTGPALSWSGFEKPPQTHPVL